MPPLTTNREQSNKETLKTFVEHEVREALRAQANNADYKSVEMVADDIISLAEHWLLRGGAMKNTNDPKYEFHRGWEGGYRQGIRDAFNGLVKGKESKVGEEPGDFEKGLVTLKIPRKNIKQLKAETEKELQYP